MSIHLDKKTLENVKFMFELYSDSSTKCQGYQRLLELIEFNKDDQGSITIPDIRNKLSPLTHLISMVERGEQEYALESLEQAKKSINYLSRREVYEGK
jgi:hypothetical protein